ncbi:MAG: GTP cyclohydrolase, FolE2/MptA family, partial [Candidatus Zixiibacteriota bacterium]
GMKKMPFPMKVVSRVYPEGQMTVGDISIDARITAEFEARWIDKFIQIVHRHRDRIGTRNLRANIADYIKELQAASVRINYEYPFFMEKQTPISKEKCLVRYHCTYSAKISRTDEKPKVIFKIDVPVITTDPASDSDKAGGLFGQLSLISLEVKASEDPFPEDLIELVDKRALSPVYSFLTAEDQMHIIQKVHQERKSSVVVTDEIKEGLTHIDNIEWFSVRCFNSSMLHSFSTMVSIEKGMWVPMSGLDGDDI